MRALIIGINHQIQPVRIGSSSTSGELERFEQGQKDQFRELLHKRIAERSVQFIGEEARHGQESIAQRACASKGCRYANIEIPPDERAAQHIPTNYEEDETLSREQKDSFHSQREAYMFEKTTAEAHDAESALVICGYSHTPALAKRFREAGHDVAETDIRDETWYVEDWVSHMFRLP
jgi:hypothetical protein